MGEPKFLNVFIIRIAALLLLGVFPANFAARPTRRLLWFYARTPFHEQAYLVYPVAQIPR